MVAMSMPASRRAMAHVCLSTCGVTVLAVSDGQLLAAVWAYLVTSDSTASVLSVVPRRLGKSGAPGLPPRSASQLRRVATAGGGMWVAASFLPPPPQSTLWPCVG